MKNQTIDNTTGQSLSNLAMQSGQTPIAAMATSQITSGQLALESARTKADIDIQISTAKNYPRSVSNVANQVHSLVMLDDETAAECIYALPRGGKAIRGPSIRFAEILASQWGNSRQGSRVVHMSYCQIWCLRFQGHAAA